MKFELPPLPYEFSALEPYIDRTTMMIHHGKHHQAYVDKLNSALESSKDIKNYRDIGDLLSHFEEIPEEIKTAVRNNAGGHANHSLFWQMMTPVQDQSPDAQLKEALEAQFGSVQSFKEKFTDIAVKLFGSGWTWLVVNQGKLEVMTTANQDSPLMEDVYPLVGLDLWEHAYYLKYQNRRSEYIDAWWHVVSWEYLNERLQNAPASQ